MTYTIKTSEIERLTKELYLKNEDEEILEVDIVELNETDQHGDHFGLSFKAKINMEFSFETGDYFTPPSHTLESEEIEILEIKIYNALGDEVELSQENFNELELELTSIIENL